MIKKISSATLLFAVFIVMLSSCSIIEKNPSYKISNQYNVLINRDFWGIPYIKGQTDQDLSQQDLQCDSLISLANLF